MRPFRGSEPGAYNSFKHLISVGSGFESQRAYQLLEDLMTKWNEYFKIVDNDKSDIDNFEWDNHEYQIVIIATGEVIGTYKDERYAIKQAKHKFKRIVSQVEKILLG